MYQRTTFQLPLKKCCIHSWLIIRFVDFKYERPNPKPKPSNKLGNHLHLPLFGVLHHSSSETKQSRNASTSHFHTANFVPNLSVSVFSVCPTCKDTRPLP